jgi:ring-1,2-phenylacetyl-CoA epoxidase subunit PaaE
MSVHKFFPVRVQDIRQETAECISVALDIPRDLSDTFRFIPGQYLTFHKQIDGADIRRSYSICSGVNDGELRVAIKKVEHGRFTTYAHEKLKVGDIIEVMPPHGNFVSKVRDKDRKNYLAFAAGSGITPIMSILKTALETEPGCTFTLVYGNRTRMSIIFREEIEALKNKYIERLRLFHVLSRELMDVSQFNGRINADKCREICQDFIDLSIMDEAFICGPEDMLLAVRQQLTDMGLPAAQIHIELFTSPEQPKASHQAWVATHPDDKGPMSKVAITVDGTTFEMDVPFNGESILDAALRTGADLPFACKGGVCCTCRAKLLEGEVEMEVNYALEAEEVKRGFVLTCQSHPRTDRVVIDFDER